ncbi:MAG: DNA-directed RNA polymerase subunit beta [Candidatus Nasuia deltocephalinicola]
MNNFLFPFRKKLFSNYHNYKKSNNYLNNINLFFFLQNSYKCFLDKGLKKIFDFTFPIYAYKTKNILEFFSYKVFYPRNSQLHCLNNGLSFCISIRITFRIFDYNIDFNSLKILKNNVRFEDINIPNIPMITSDSTFIIDGVEKVIVSKFIRSPGLYFIKSKNIKKKKFILKLVPDFGSEIDFILDHKNLLYLNYKDKFILLTDILKSSGMSNKEIISTFYNFFYIFVFESSFKVKFDSDLFLNYSFPYDILNYDNQIIVKKNKIISLDDIKNIKDNFIEYVFVEKDFILGKHLGCDLYFENIKFANVCDELNDDVLKNIIYYNIKSFSIIVYGSQNHASVILTLKNGKFLNKNNDYFSSLNNLNIFLNFLGSKIFNFNILNYNSNYFKRFFIISDICRKKMNFYFKKNFNFNYLARADIVNIIKILISFKDGFFKETKSLNLSNLNLHMGGEMLYEIFCDFFLKLKSSFKNVFFNIDTKPLTHYIKIPILLSKIKSLFSSSKYSQYLEQVNIISEISHKRRVVFLGVIGISKKYSGFDARDLDSSHYSRLCPVETPEGINIGLVNSLALLCKVDKYNFLVSPYYKIENKKVSSRWIYLPVSEELNSFIAEPTQSFENFENINQVLSKYGDNLSFINSDIVNYINVLPYQMLSITALLVPFIENNDPNRALMASNMLKQALPLVYPSRPVVATGFEGIVGFNSKSIIRSLNKSFIEYQDSRFIILKNIFNFKDFYYYNYDLYFLSKYHSTNQKTINSQRALIFSNNKIFNSGEIIADGASTDLGELSLGQNVFAAFMTWEGYNFEDSIIVSEKLVLDEKYTSLELIRLDVDICYFSSKNFESLTKDVVKNFILKKNLNKFGLIKIGSKVYGGDILVSKICPIINDFEEINPNQRLLYSMFSGNSEYNYKDTSFKLPEKFSSGVVISVETYFSNSYPLNNFDKLLLRIQKKRFLNSKKKKYKFIKKKIEIMIKDFLFGKNCIIDDTCYFSNFDFLNKRKFKDIFKIKICNIRFSEMFEILKKKVIFFFKIYDFLKKNSKNKFLKDLSNSLSKMVKIIIIVKKKLQVGDKMSGRHGNKGVISKILPINEMPYLFNGRIIEMILNPLGVPSRMNVGQLLEIHLGFISLCLGWKIYDLLFKNNSFNKIKDLLLKIYNKDINKDDLDSLNFIEILNLVNFFKNGIYFSINPFSGFKECMMNNILDLIFSENFLFDHGVSQDKKKIFLYDGRSGEKFKSRITVGLMYMLKLNHLAEDKIHARSVGPYSMITQQPLKGKSNKGGQRLGEMEVWALEAYGAFYSLQEMFTVKSDDVKGRFKTYSNIIKGISEYIFNRPETFNVMLKNINSLSLYIRFNDY